MTEPLEDRVAYLERRMEELIGPRTTEEERLADHESWRVEFAHKLEEMNAALGTVQAPIRLRSVGDE